MADNPKHPPVTSLCACGCGLTVVNTRSWLPKKYYSHAHQVKHNKELHFVRRVKRKKGAPVIPVKPWDGPLCECGRLGKCDGKCGEHAYSRRYQVRKRNRLIKELTEGVSDEHLKLLLDSFGSLGAISRPIW